MLGGLAVWALHFGGVYLIASIFDVVDRADAFGSRLTVLGFTAACLAANAAILALIVRHPRDPEDEVEGWMLAVGGLGAGFSLVAVVWQGLPAVIGY